MKNNIQTCFLLLITFIVIAGFYSCEKDDGLKNLSNKIKTSDREILNVSYKTAEVKSRIPNNSNVEIDEYGHCWSTDSMPDIDDSISVFSESSNEIFISKLEKLNHNTQYYLRTYFKFDDICRYDSVMTFKTLEIKPPSVQINGYSSLRAYSVDFGGQVTDFYAIKTDSVGFCWSTENNPTVENESIVGIITDELEDYSLFSSKIENLDIDTEYFIRAYAANEAGIVYSNEVSFTTPDGTPLISLSVNSINTEDANFVLQISDDFASISEAGVLWSTSSPVTDTDNKIAVGTDIGEYNVNITGLQQAQKYYIKAFAENEYGRVYTQETGFNTRESFNGVEFVYVDGGTFVMGTNEGNGFDGPEHNVMLSSFKISVHEITNSQYCEFLNSVGVSSDGTLNGSIYSNVEFSDNNYISFINDSFVVIDGYENYPANYMSWYAAKNYCEWLGGRLPTEAEWEYAARGGTNSSDDFIYSGSNQIGDVGWYEQNAGQQTKEIGLKFPNQLGIYDMSGNVFEWCSDWIGPYDSEDQENPIGRLNEYNGNKVTRGGSCNINSIYCKVDYRGGRDPSYAPGDIGIRVVLPLE